MNSRISVVMFAGYLLGFLLLVWLRPSGLLGAGLGWALCAGIEMVLLRRRLEVLDPAKPAIAFGIVLVGGFLVKLLLLTGLSLLAQRFQLFQPKPFMLAFLAALVWGEFHSLILLHRHQQTGKSPTVPMEKDT